ncbi:MAG: DUF4258 domain-containing protein [Candidatus Hydrogenedentota bacterium]
MLKKEVVFTHHARQKMCERGVAEESVIQSIHIGEREPAQRGLWQYRLNLEFQCLWAGRYYGIQQVMPVVDEEKSRYVVVTVYAFYFQEGQER